VAIKTIEELFVHKLSDIYSAEKQLTKALPKLARASQHPELAQAFMTHLEETQGRWSALIKSSKRSRFA
jgi:ferritin-like metal-binding protein YciE